MPEKHAKILVVDDLPENLHAMQVTLTPLEIEIHTASSGNEALAMMIMHEYAVILLDVQMPHMDGFEAASLMQNNASTRGVPIIFVTAISKENQHVFKGYETGAVDYLFKPVNPDILLSKVKVFVNLYNTKIEYKNMQQELQKSKNLESLGLLAGGIAHDFNNILAAIIGNIDLATMLLDPVQNNTEIELLKKSTQASMRAKGLTYQLLTFARGGDPVKALSSIVQVVKESADFVLHGSNVSCQYDFPDNLWNAELDTSQISQVVQNIIINAIQAMPDGGTIAIQCRNFTDNDTHILPDPTRKYIEIKIRDSGVGIPADLLDKVFDPYMTTKTTGNGLGLSICHSIIKKHAGKITVTSLPGVGTTFTILLPASSESQIISKEIPPTNKKRIGKILVMDDEETIRILTSTMLNLDGHEVVLAEDGLAAIKLYQESCNSEKPIDLTIMDLTIPGSMGGQEAVLEILRINPAAKVIVSSGYATDPIMANHSEYGFIAAISKPYELKTLLDTVRQHIGD